MGASSARFRASMAVFNEERRLSRAFDSWGLVTIVEARSDRGSGTARKPRKRCLSGDGRQSHHETPRVRTAILSRDSTFCELISRFAHFYSKTTQVLEGEGCSERFNEVPSENVPSASTRKLSPLTLAFNLRVPSPTFSSNTYLFLPSVSTVLQGGWNQWNGVRDGIPKLRRRDVGWW